jgi:hypothetical protein
MFDANNVYLTRLALSMLGDLMYWQLSWVLAIDAASPTGVHHMLIFWPQ